MSDQDRVQPQSTSRHWSIWLPPLLVFVIAVVIAVRDYQQFQQVHPQMWSSALHDRNAHYVFALKIANYIKAGELYPLVKTINSARVWPPLHGVLVASTLLVTGFDYRLAVLPNLAAWVVMVWLGFLVARRVIGSDLEGRTSLAGNLAGAVAVVFLLTSPGHRRFAVDIMLESLGACLSLAVLYAYLIAVQRRPSWKTGRWLGLALSVLFLHKYNYWLLVVFALVVSELLTEPRERLKAAWNFLREIPWRDHFREHAKLPTLYIFFAFVALISVVFVRGKDPLVWGEFSLRVYPPLNLIQFAYITFVIHLAIWWRRHGRAWSKTLDIRVQQVVRWHLWPVALYMLLPRHMGYFLWFLSPANTGADSGMSFWDGLQVYGPWMTSYYHIATWGAIVAFSLLAVTLLAGPWLRRGGLAVVSLSLIGLFLTCTHPNHQSRYLHSWLPAVWVSAGVGFALVCSLRLPVWRQVGPWLGGVGVACAVFLWFPSLVGPVYHHADDGFEPHRPNLLCLRKAILPDLGGERVAVLSGIPIRFFVEWTCLEKYGKCTHLEKISDGFGTLGVGNHEGFQHWLGQNQCETMIYVDHVNKNVRWEMAPVGQLHGELRNLVLEQRIFHLDRQVALPEIGCQVYVFKKKQSVAQTTKASRGR